MIIFCPNQCGSACLIRSTKVRGNKVICTCVCEKCDEVFEIEYCKFKRLGQARKRAI